MRKIKKKKVRQECVRCHKKSFYISQNGLCKKCMANQIISANYQMKAKQGPVYEKWKKSMKQSMEQLA